MTVWQWRTFSELTSQELYDILAVRQEVFGIEQNCLYQDLDYKDQSSIHLIGKKAEKIVAYLRLFPWGTTYSDAISFGRVLTVKSERGKGLAGEAMQQVIKYLEGQKKPFPATISAQLYLKDFYLRYGLKAIGESYDEDGIPHIKMHGHLKPC